MGLESCEHGVVLVSSGVTACMSCFMLPWQGQDLVWFARAPSRGRRSAFYALKLLRKGGQKCKLGGSACVEFAIYVAFVGLWGSKRSGISVCVAGAVLAIFIWHVTSRCCNDRAGRGLVTQPYTRNLTQPYTPLSWICVRGWVGSVCVAEFWPCAPLSWICVRRWVVYPRRCHSAWLPQHSAKTWVFHRGVSNGPRVSQQRALHHSPRRLSCKSAQEKSPQRCLKRGVQKL